MALYVDIEKKFGSFTLKTCFETENEIFAILGASGCGKSLTLKCIAGIEKPDKGIIRLDDRVLFDSEKHINVPARKRRIGYLFQDYALFPNMTVLENIMCGTKSTEAAMEYVRKFYLEGKERLYPSQLSGGQKQRVALARMLAADPRYLLLDEPFSALDNYLKTLLERELYDMFEQYGRRVLFVSHDRNEVYRLTDRIAVMEDGKVMEIRPKKELFDAPGTLASVRLTGCKNITALKAIEPVETGGKADDKKGHPSQVYASDWGIRMELENAAVALKEGLSLTEKYHYGAVRAHYFVPAKAEDAGKANVICCRILREIQDTFTTTILFENAMTDSRSVLTAEFPQNQWEEIKRRTVLAGEKLYLRILADKIMLLEK